MRESMSEQHEDREGLIIRNAELRKLLAIATREANVLRREVHAWRKWREGSSSLVKVIEAKRDTDRSGAFRCMGDD